MINPEHGQPLRHAPYYAAPATLDATPKISLAFVRISHV
jgi:hypothetical protein